MRGLFRDLGHALRILTRRPAFSAAVVLTLALGIGPNTAIFSVVDSVLLRPLPYEDPSRLVLLRVDLSGLVQHPGIARAEVLDFREQSQVLEGLGAVTRERTASITEAGAMEAVLAAGVTADLFPLLGIEPALGRLFTPEEEAPGRPTAVVLSQGLWRRRYAGDPTVIGRTLEVDGFPLTVVGVMPERFRLLLGPGTSLSPDVDLWYPLPLPREDRGFWAYRAIGRLKPGVTLEQAEADIQAVGRRIVEEYPDTYETAGIAYYVHPLHSDLVQNVRLPILALLGAVGLVLLIACTNAASLLLARNAGREREFAVRASLGAGRSGIIRQVLAESLTLALAAGLIGLLLGAVGLRVLLALQPGNLPRVDEIGLNSGVLLFTFLTALVCSLIFGILPALQASRVESAGVLRDRGSGAGRLRNGPRRILVVTEVAFSLVLLIGAGLLIRTFIGLQNVDLGYQPRSVLTFQVPLDYQRYNTPQQAWEVYHRASSRLGSLPGVRSVGAISLLPLGNQNMMASYSWGEMLQTDWNGVSADYRMVLPGYFETMQVPLLSGRTFEDRDNETVQAVAIIDETLARQAWPDGDAVGQRLRIGLGTVLEDPEVEVIGVVRHSRIIDVRRVVRPQIYLPWRLGPGPNLTFTLRTDTDPASLLPAVRTALEEVGTGRPVHTVLTMGEAVEGAMGATRFTLVLMGLLATIALLLATVGVYSLIAFIARQRTHETGIRMALGARRSDILGSNLREGLILVAIGLPLGLAGAALGARSIRGLLYGVSPIDPVTFAAVPLLLLLVGLTASVLPAWQASRVDPAVALRRE